MIRKFLPSTLFIIGAFLLIPVASQACDINSQRTVEKELIQLSALNSEKALTTLYNFRTGHCVSFTLDKEYDELEMSEFLPSDETTLGVYLDYRNKGENQINALKYTLAFNISEQQG